MADSVPTIPNYIPTNGEGKGGEEMSVPLKDLIITSAHILLASTQLKGNWEM